MAKEALKRMLARQGNAKYAMHGPNELVREARLRDGQPVIEFIRCNPHWGGVSSADRGTRLGEVITAAFLDRLVERQGACILYTHLGKGADRQTPFPPATIKVLRLLAEYHRAGKVLVTTTRRLLAYRQMTRNAAVQVAAGDGVTHVAVKTSSKDGCVGRDKVRDPEGLTAYVLDPDRTEVFVNDRKAAAIQPNAPDHTGRRSISIPWRGLAFPVF